MQDGVLEANITQVIPNEELTFKDGHDILKKNAELFKKVPILII